MAVFLVLLMSLKSIQKEREYTKFVVDERLCYYESSKNKSEKTFVEELSLSLNQKHKSIDPKEVPKILIPDFAKGFEIFFT